jgi:prepilin-type N-terminal cleavage/methylation domain-containing protein
MIRRTQGLLRKVRQHDHGVSLAEMLITMVLLGIVSLIVTEAVMQANRLVVHNRDESTGLADVRTVTERMGRDVRDARGVECDGGLADPADPTSADPNCYAHLQLWIDTNSDYVEQTSEDVTWRISKASDGIHYNVLRTVGTGAAATTQKQASTLIVRFSFSYDAAPPASQVVNIGVRYDAEVGIGTSYRNLAYSVRLRNKGSA